MIGLQAWLATRAAKLALLGVLVFVIATTGWMARGHWDAQTIAKIRNEHAEYVAQAERQAREQADKALTKQQQIIESTQEVVNEARQITESLERRITESDRASVGLRSAAEKAAARCNAASQNPATAIGSPGAIVPSGMRDGDRLLLVLGQLDGAAGAYAADSGRARAARDACQRAYETVMREVNK